MDKSFLNQTGARSAAGAAEEAGGGFPFLNPLFPFEILKCNFLGCCKAFGGAFRT